MTSVRIQYVTIKAQLSAIERVIALAEEVSPNEPTLFYLKDLIKKDLERQKEETGEPAKGPLIDFLRENLRPVIPQVVKNKENVSSTAPNVIFDRIFRNLTKINTPSFRDFIIDEYGTKIQFCESTEPKCQVVRIFTEKGNIEIHVHINGKSRNEITQEDLDGLVSRKEQLIAKFSELHLAELLSIL